MVNIPMSRTSGIARLITAIAVGLSTAACDTMIDPIEDTDMAFSIFGLLDPSADTQWIRVASFRTTILSTPDPLDATVTVEDLSTGRMIDLIPTLFSQGSGNFGDTLFAYNFRTTERIDPGSTYRLTARRSDGATSSSIARTPGEFRDSVAVLGLSQRGNTPDVLRFFVPAGADVAMMNALVFPIERCEFLPVLTEFISLPDHPPLQEGAWQTVNIRRSGKNWGTACVGAPLAEAINRNELRIVLSGDVWPFDPGYDVSHINAVDRVENGVGFLGGVIRRYIPFDSCWFTGPGAPDVCYLYYGPDTATLMVTAVNGLALPSNSFFPTITLVRGEETWRRSGDPFPAMFVDSSLGRRFSGLLPGDYGIRLQLSSYCEERNIVLAPGESRSIDVEMGHLAPGEVYNSNGCRER